MNGKVDTLAETQNLRLLVEPRLDEGAALAGALLGGPVVGLGALVASKILQDPIAKAASSVLRQPVRPTTNTPQSSRTHGANGGAAMRANWTAPMPG